MIRGLLHEAAGGFPVGTCPRGDECAQKRNLPVGQPALRRGRNQRGKLTRFHLFQKSCQPRVVVPVAGGMADEFHAFVERRASGNRGASWKNGLDGPSPFPSLILLPEHPPRRKRSNRATARQEQDGENPPGNLESFSDHSGRANRVLFPERATSFPPPSGRIEDRFEPNVPR